MTAPTNDREFIAWCREQFSIRGCLHIDSVRRLIVLADSKVPEDRVSVHVLILLIDLADARAQVAERDAEIEEITKWAGNRIDHFEYEWGAIVSQPDESLSGDALEAKRRMLDFTGVAERDATILRLKSDAALPAAVASPRPCKYASTASDGRSIVITGAGPMPHDPTTCWWCLNPQTETEVAHMRQYSADV